MSLAVAERPFIVFGAPLVGDEEIEAVVETMRSGWLGTGPRSQEFERRVAEYTGAPFAIAVNSGTAALHLSMLALGLGPGDEVITTPLTFCATVNAILHTGATPVFVDPDRRTQNITAEGIEAAVTERTRAILPVHMAGRPCDMEAIGEIADRHGLAVIEDAAHALGASLGSQRVGSISPYTCFSFYVTKNITTAEGGMICVQDEAMATRLHTLALHGLSGDAWARFSDKGYKHYEVVAPGYKYNMTDMAAALGLVQFSKLDRWQARREQLWQRYDAALSGLPCSLPAPPAADMVHARHLYTIHLHQDEAPVSRDELMVKLRERGIGTGVHYRSVHLHDYYRRRFGFQPEDYPNAAWISDRTLSLPLSQALSDEDVERILREVRAILTGH